MSNGGGAEERIGRWFVFRLSGAGAHGERRRDGSRQDGGGVFDSRSGGALLRDLAEAFATNEVNLSSIQSRPSKRRAWDYVFFVELDGHISEVKVLRALRKAEEHTVFLKVLGSWPVPGE